VRVDSLSTPASDFWVKRDDLTHSVYGGNKVRKLERIIEAAKARGATRLVTLGAAGSHHVLATTYFGTRAGLAIEAVLVPQPVTPHVLDVLRADVAQGLRAFPVDSWSRVPLVFAARVAAGASPVTVGGSNVVGSMAYVDAAIELAEQVRRGELPEPDVCVVALGSGGTAAGLAAGFVAAGLKTRVVGVCVSDPAWVVRALARRLARACAKRRAIAVDSLAGRLTFDDRFLGAGYGYETDVAREAATVAERAAGLTLDPTYTAKTFASALWHVRARQARRVLYWHTLSSAPMEPLMGDERTPFDSALARLVAPPLTGRERET
jgi:1-aminocyclopropane-1-carboxylate deaminase/D-cysteine desulfhydrase-like pyridoxal-dependent ACC family enzyme